MTLPLRSIGPALWFAALLPLSVCGAQTPGALERFYAWPPSPERPTAMGSDFWDWRPAPDDTGGELLLDLRPLNEAVAGQHGWVQRRGDKLFLADGRPVRFWAVNTTGNAPPAELERLAAALARRGVNLVRIHGGAGKSLLDFRSGDLHAVNRAVIDQMHRAVVAAKKSGLYTFVSNSFFIIEMKVRASHGLEGYTQAWLDTHPGQQVPFGLVFLNDRLRAAFKGWLREFVTAPNPYDERRTPLAQDRAVAVIELLNEDNLFFYTFKPASWPPEQRVLAGRKFFQWVAGQHRRPSEDAAATVRRLLAAWHSPHPEDDPAAGVLGLAPAATMGHTAAGAARLAAQIEFLGGVQRGFHAEMTAVLRGAGYGGLVSASNWKTANDAVLLDLEFEIYRAGDIIDRHTYYAPVVAQEKVKHRIGVGDTFLGLSALAVPRGSPANVRQMEGFPSAQSEFAWVNYNAAGVEAPLVSAAYFALTDFDLPVWFALGTKPWSERLGKWEVGRPSMLGQFPGAALLFRRGDVAEATVVAREGRTLASIHRREPARLMPGRGFDSTRDDPAAAQGDAPGGSGGIDPLAMLVGKVEVTYDTDADFVSPRLGEFIDRSNGRVTSLTGQLITDWRRGLLTIATPRSQGVAGWLRAAGRIDLGDVAFESRNAFGTLLAIALDDRPLARSEKVLVQVGAIDRLTGFATEPVRLAWQDADYAGDRIVATGHAPWQVQRVDAVVTLRGLAPRVRSAVALDENGRARAPLTGEAAGADYVLRLPPDSLYTVIRLAPAAVVGR